MQELQVQVPKIFCPVRARSFVLDGEQLHDEIVHLDVLEAVHDVYIVRRRVPSFVWARKKA